MNSFHYLDEPQRNRSMGNGRAEIASPLNNFDASRPYILEADDSGKLSEYFRVLLRHKLTVIVWSLLGLAFAFLVSLPQKSVYRAQAALEIQDPNENILNKAFEGNTQGPNSDEAETLFQTQIRLLRSDSLLDRVATRLKLKEKTSPRHPSLIRNLLHLPQPNIQPHEQLLQDLAQNLTVRVSGQTRVVEVMFDSADPALAASVANALVNEFIEQRQEVRWQSAQRAGEWLTRQLAEMKVKLEKSEAQLQEMAKASGMGLGTDSDKGSIEDSKLRQLEDELSKAEAERLDRQSKLELAEKVGVESLPEGMNDPTIRDYSIKLTDLNRQEAELSANLTPAHYKVREVQQQIESLNKALEKARLNIMVSIRREYEQAQSHETLLQAACTQQMRRVTRESSNAVEFNMLKHEVDTSRHLYEILLQRVKEAGVESAMRASNVLIVDPARKPMFPYKPNFVMNSMIGLAGGLFMGMGFIFYRDQANRSFRDRGELSLQLNLPELGAIPETRGRLLQVDLNPRRTLLLDDGTVKDHRSESLELATWSHKPSLLAESFRATLPSILFHESTGKRPRVMVVTSPNPGEGKTTIATNLAIAISEIVSRVLIVDGDLRRQRIHQVFKVENTNGLGNLLNSKDPLTVAQVEEAVQSTAVSGLFVLTGGSNGHDIGNLFYSRRLPELIEIFRKQFDTVIIDTPPILQISDGRLIARFSDGLILIARAGQTARESVMLAHKRIAEDGSCVLGTILNSWDPGKINRYAYSSWK
jgi:capsular exopolysaccharide synthesis family protein